MDTLDAIAGRRSIRRFRDSSVSDEALHAILTAAVQAPSGKNEQPWRFIVVREEGCAEMIRLMREGISEKAQEIASIKLSYQCLAGGQLSFAKHHEIAEHSICSMLIPESLRR